MKSFITKILILVGLVSIVPFFSYAATTVECYPYFSNDLIGEPVSIYAQVSDGNDGAYDYSWSGDDGLSDTEQEISYTYSTEGAKTINITASSTVNSDVLTGSCSVNIYTDDTIPTDFSASCTPNVNEGMIDQSIKWGTSVSGDFGGDYSIKWKGIELDEVSFNDSQIYTVNYPTSGLKTAIMSAFQSRYGDKTPLYNAKISAVEINCTDSVNIKSPDPEPLIVTGSCSASSNSIYLDEAVTWNSSLENSGGLAPYTVNWTDNEENIGSGDLVTKTYSTIGDKSAYLIVKDAMTQSQRIDCGSVSVINRPNGGHSHSNNLDDSSNDAATSTETTNTEETATSTATSTPDNTTSENNNEVTYDIFDDYLFNNDQNPGGYGEDIANLQSRLTEEGFYNGLIGGFLGSVTEQALRDYQIANSLPETGVLDAATRAMLNSRFLGTDSLNNNGLTNGEVSSKISGLTATVLEALGSGVNYIKSNGIILSILILLILIGLPTYWFKFRK